MEGLTGREQSPWLCHVTPAEVYTTSNRILDLIQESDPFGDRITQHELRIFSQAFADLGNSQALYRFQHGLDQSTPKDCPVCGGDCASANPPVTHCPMRDGATALPSQDGKAST